MGNLRKDRRLYLYLCMLVSTSILHTNNSLATPTTCSDVCEYDDWFKRAHCEERSLYSVPLSTGCEASYFLELQENRITGLNESTLSGYRHVKTLDISRNEISSIGSSIFANNPRLTNILISRNHIGALPDYTFNGTEDYLTRIYLTRNKISNISDNALRGLGHLLTLYLSLNLINSLPSTLFHDLHRMEYLYLSENKLDHLDPNTFKGLTNLRILYLDSNKLQWLPEGLFDGLISIEEVRLSNNVLTVLPPPESLGPSHYQVLDLRENNFNTSSSVVSYLHITERIYMDGNPFVCDCSFLVIQSWYQNISEADRVVYNLEVPACDKTSSNNPLLLERDTNDCSDGAPISTSTSMLPTSTLVTTHVSVSKVIDPSESIKGTNQPKISVPTEQKSFVGADCANSDLHILENKLLGTLIYCAVIITIFFGLWLVKSSFELHSKCSTKQADINASVQDV